MRIVFYMCLVGFLTLGSCATQQIAAVPDATLTASHSDTVKIANEELEYEIIIFDPGFNAWMLGRAWPRGYYSESFLEVRNRLMVMEWNNRVLQPSRYDPNLYQLRIEFDPTVHYGYEVNYLLYHYFVYFQMTYKQNLSGVPPRL